MPSDRPQQTTHIVGQLPQLSGFGVMKHLDGLREAGLVDTRTEGRLRINSLNAASRHHGTLDRQVRNVPVQPAAAGQGYCGVQVCGADDR